MPAESRQALARLLLVAAAALAAAPAFALAQGEGGGRAEPLPAELEGVGIVEHLGGRLPMERAFLDSTGRKVTLGDAFGRGRPVVLSFNYSSCPMLCHLQRDGLLESLAGLNWTVGREFDVVIVGLDPNESPERAAFTRQKTLKAYGRPEAAEGWTFLVGREIDIRAVADAAGFGYRYVAERDEYAHAAALVVCTPDGTIARYLYGVKYDPKTLKLSLLEAGEGKVGSPLEQILLFCFHYDPSTKRYAPAAMNLMRLAAGAMVLTLLSFLLPAWLRGRAGSAPNHPPSPTLG